MYIPRAAEATIQSYVQNFKIVLVTGARQVGKSTLLRQLFGEEYEYVALDDFHTQQIIQSSPEAFFLNHPGKLILDEIQQAPVLFSFLKHRVDQSPEYGQYILTGSQTFSLMAGVSESLAGRVGIFSLDSLSLREQKQDSYDEPFLPTEAFLAALPQRQTQASEVDLSSDKLAQARANLWQHIHRGSFPELTKNPNLSTEAFYSSYLQTYLERDVRSLLQVENLGVFAEFIQALAALTSQVLNYQNLSKLLGVTAKTIKKWVGVLEASGLVYLLPTFTNNRLQRVIKAPKLYFMDTGLVAYLLRWPNAETMMAGPMAGPLFENYVVSEVVKSYHNRGILHPPLTYYRDRNQREIDLVIEEAATLYPVEIKSSPFPLPRMAKHFDVLEQAAGKSLGKGIILCPILSPTYLTETVVAYPAAWI